MAMPSLISTSLRPRRGCLANVCSLPSHSGSVVPVGGRGPGGAIPASVLSVVSSWQLPGASAVLPVVEGWPVSSRTGPWPCGPVLWSLKTLLIHLLVGRWEGCRLYLVSCSPVQNGPGLRSCNSCSSRVVGSLMGGAAVAIAQVCPSSAPGPRACP